MPSGTVVGAGWTIWSAWAAGLCLTGRWKELLPGNGVWLPHCPNPAALPATHAVARADPPTWARQDQGTYHGPDKVLRQAGSNLLTVFCPPRSVQNVYLEHMQMHSI